LAKIFGLLTWPMIALIGLIFFYPSINRIAELLPGKFEQSSEITIGSLISLKIQEQAKASGNEELAKIIEGLSKDAIEWILKIGNSPHRVIGSDDGRTGQVANYYIASGYAAWIELSDGKLLKSTVDLREYKAFFDSLGPTDGKIPVGSLTKQQQDRLLNNS